MEALMAAASRQLSRSPDDSVAESELYSMAEELGIDSNRLRQVLGRGTGAIQSRDQISHGIRWPGPEQFERIVDGKLSEAQLEERADPVGSRYEDQGTPGARESREIWPGWRNVTVDLVKREGKTRIVARPRISSSRLLLLMPFAFLPIIINLAVIAKNPNPANLVGFVALLGVMVATWFLIGWQMRRNRETIRGKVDDLALAAKSAIQSHPLSSAVDARELSHGFDHLGRSRAGMI